MLKAFRGKKTGIKKIYDVNGNNVIKNKLTRINMTVVLIVCTYLY